MLADLLIWGIKASHSPGKSYIGMDTQSGKDWIEAWQLVIG